MTKICCPNCDVPLELDFEKLKLSVSAEAAKPNVSGRLLFILKEDLHRIDENVNLMGRLVGELRLEDIRHEKQYVVDFIERYSK